MWSCSVLCLRVPFGLLNWDGRIVLSENTFCFLSYSQAQGVSRPYDKFGHLFTILNELLSWLLLGISMDLVFRVNLGRIYINRLFYNRLVAGDWLLWVLWVDGWLISLEPNRIIFQDASLPLESNLVSIVNRDQYKQHICHDKTGLLKCARFIYFMGDAE